jgi:hypothetical protein
MCSIDLMNLLQRLFNNVNSQGELHKLTLEKAPLLCR